MQSRCAASLLTIVVLALTAPALTASPREPSPDSGRADRAPPGVEGYRHGAEALAHVGADYPITSRLALLLQSNYRVRAKNDVGDTGDEEEANTGGAALYVTPGLRVDLLRGERRIRSGNGDWPQPPGARPHPSKDICGRRNLMPFPHPSNLQGGP